MLISFVHIRVCLRRHNTQTSTNVESNDPKVEFLFEMQWVYNCLFTLDGDVFTACKRGMEQGNVFTPVCHSVHRGWGWLPSMHHRSHDQGVCLQWGLHPQGVCIQGGVGYTRPSTSEYGQQAGGMLPLECILVWFFFCRHSCQSRFSDQLL